MPAGLGPERACGVPLLGVGGLVVFDRGDSLGLRLVLFGRICLGFRLDSLFLGRGFLCSRLVGLVLRDHGLDERLGLGVSCGRLLGLCGLGLLGSDELLLGRQLAALGDDEQPELGGDSPNTVTGTV